MEFTRKECVSYIDKLQEIKVIRKEVENVFKKEEIKSYITISDKYKKATEKDSALKALLLISSYHERLLAIKIDLCLLLEQTERCTNIVKRELKSLDGFSKLSKKDQDSIIDIELGKFIDFQEYISARIDVMNKSIEYLNNVQFNLKSVLSTFKSY